MTILFIINQAPCFKWTKLYTYSKNNIMHINFEKFGVSKIFKCFFKDVSLWSPSLHLFDQKYSQIQ